MCCWPFNSIYLEEEPKKQEEKKDPGVLVLNPVSRSTVHLGVGFFAPQPPMIYSPTAQAAASPCLQQPAAAYSLHYTNPLGMNPVNNASPYGQPGTYPHYGYTPNEYLAQQMATADALGMNKKQEMKPADDDPMRFYWVREFDGTWTQRNRLTIDSGDIGDCRWYAKDGEFYAVRLET